MNPIEKLTFPWQKPKIAVAVGANQEMVKRTISRILGPSFKIKKELLFTTDPEKEDLSKKKYLILNFDNNNTRRFKEKTPAKILTFGFRQGADFQASDIRANGGTNFKINNQGNIVPIWLGETLNQEEIYQVLAAVAIGTIFDLNLVEISQALTSVTK